MRQRGNLEPKEWGSFSPAPSLTLSASGKLCPSEASAVRCDCHGLIATSGVDVDVGKQPPWKNVGTEGLRWKAEESWEVSQWHAGTLEAAGSPRNPS